MREPRRRRFRLYPINSPEGHSLDGFTCLGSAETLDEAHIMRRRWLAADNVPTGRVKPGMYFPWGIAIADLALYTIDWKDLSDNPPL